VLIENAVCALSQIALSWHDDAMSDVMPSLSLRVRKKQRTRQAIQRAALDLIERAGYDATTVEQIAENADVSPATFFRYFPTKASVLIDDGLDALLVSAMAHQRSDISVLESLRRALMVLRAGLSGTEWEFERQLLTLGASIPEARELQHAEHRRTAVKLARLTARRLGRDEDDFEIRAFFNALADAILSVVVVAPNVPDEMFDVIDFVEAGLPLQDSRWAAGGAERHCEISTGRAAG
jgi:AcrR family transcriptional regulator